MSLAPDGPAVEPVPTMIRLAHKVAADRMMRLARDHGALEALSFYDELTPGERRHTTLVLAHLAGGHADPAPPDMDSPWWTDDELRRCNNLFQQGHRSAWVIAGRRLYQRHLARRRRRLAAQGVPLTRGRPVGGHLESIRVES